MTNRRKAQAIPKNKERIFYVFIRKRREENIKMQAIWDFIISIPGYVLMGCNYLMGNQYILALFLFAIIIEIVLLPFAIKQQKTSIKQARLRPKEMAIRKKYAGRDDQPTKQKTAYE